MRNSGESRPPLSLSGPLPFFLCVRAKSTTTDPPNPPTDRLLSFSTILPLSLSPSTNDLQRPSPVRFPSVRAPLPRCVLSALRPAAVTLPPCLQLKQPADIHHPSSFVTLHLISYRTIIASDSLPVLLSRIADKAGIPSGQTIGKEREGWRLKYAWEGSEWSLDDGRSCCFSLGLDVEHWVGTRVRTSGNARCCQDQDVRIRRIVDLGTTALPASTPYPHQLPSLSSKLPLCLTERPLTPALLPALLADDFEILLSRFKSEVNLRLHAPSPSGVPPAANNTNGDPSTSATGFRRPSSENGGGGSIHGGGDKPSRVHRGDATSGAARRARGEELKHEKEFTEFHSTNGVRTVQGSIGPVENGELEEEKDSAYLLQVGMEDNRADDAYNGGHSPNAHQGWLP